MLRRTCVWPVAAAIIATGVVASRAQEAGTVDTAVINPVDPDRAKADFERAQQTSFAEQLVFPNSLKFGDFNPAVPIMIPMKVFRDLKAGVAVASSADKRLTSQNQESDVTFDENGYFVTVSYPGEGFNLTVEGTRRGFVRKKDEAAFAGPKPDYVNIFESQAKFGYAGADYLLLFECTVGDAKCISQAGIGELLNGFVLCDRDNQCVNFFPEKQGEQP